MRPSVPSFISISLFAVAVAATLTTRANPNVEPPPPAGVGSVVEGLTVRGKSFPSVRIKTISRTGVTFQHEGGLTTALWSDLPPDWRIALSSQIPITPTPRLKVAPHPTPLPVLVEPTPIAGSNIEHLLLNLGQPPEIRPSVDMREHLQSLGLWVKNQGKRPSCSVYAILSALELQYADLTHQAVRFDEEHVIKATEAVTQRHRDVEADDPNSLADAGYTLPEVILAIRAHGLRILADSNDTASGNHTLPDAPKVALHLLPRSSPAVMVSNLVHALNAGLPVPIGLNWPAARAAQGGYLNTQPSLPGSRHAVTLVGYQCNSGRLEDTVFVFKNSWGVSWGASGYGRVTYSYLARELQCAVVLELPQPTLGAQP